MFHGFVLEHSGLFQDVLPPSIMFRGFCSRTFRVIPGCSTMFQDVLWLSIIFRGVPLGSGASCIFSMTFCEVLCGGLLYLIWRSNDVGGGQEVCSGVKGGGAIYVM